MHQPFFRFVLLFVAALWNKQRADEKRCSDKEATFFFFLAACYFFKLCTLDTETTLKSIYPNCCYFEICHNFVEMLNPESSAVYSWTPGSHTALRQSQLRADSSRPRFGLELFWVTSTDLLIRCHHEGILRRTLLPLHQNVFSWICSVTQYQVCQEEIATSFSFVCACVFLAGRI